MANLVQATISGAHADLFEITSGTIRPKTGAVLDFESQSSLSILVTAIYSDYSIVGYPIVVNLININEAPGQVFVVPNTVTVQEDRTAELKLADIAIADDALGTNQLSLSGSAGVANLEIRGNQLWLKSNPTLDFSATPEISATISASDPTLPDAPVNVGFLLRVSPAQNQAPIFSAGAYNAAIATFADVGTEVLTVAAVDPEGKAISYSISHSSHPGFFSINSSTGIVSIAQSLLSLSQNIYLTIAASDAGSPPQTSSASVEIELLIPPAPTIFVGIIELSSGGETVVLTSSKLDANLEGNTDNIVFNVSSLVNVSFAIAGQSVTEFTTNQISAGSVSLIYSGAGVGSFSVTATKFSRTSAPHGVTFRYKPWLTKADIRVTSAINSYRLTSSDIQYIDHDSAPSLVTFNVSGLSTNGSFRRIATVTPVSSFTAQDLIEKNIGISATENTGTISYSISATDSAGLQSQTLSDTVPIVANIIPTSTFVLSMEAGTSKVLTQSDALASNGFTPPEYIIYSTSYSESPSVTFHYVADPLTSISEFSQLEINNGLVQISVQAGEYFDYGLGRNATQQPYIVTAEGVESEVRLLLVNILPSITYFVGGTVVSLSYLTPLNPSFATILNSGDSLVTTGYGTFSVSDVSGGFFVFNGSNTYEENISSFTLSNLNDGIIAVKGAQTALGKMIFDIQYTRVDGLTSEPVTVEIPGVVSFVRQGISLNPSGETKSLLPQNIGASCLGAEDGFSFTLSELSSNIYFTKDSAVITAFTIADLTAGSVMLVYSGGGDPIAKVTAVRGASSGFMYLAFAEVLLNYQPISLSSSGEVITLTPTILSASLSGSTAGFIFFVSSIENADIRRIVPNISNTSVTSFTSQELLDGQIVFDFNGYAPCSARIKAIKNSIEAEDDLVFRYRPTLTVSFPGTTRVGTNISTAVTLNTSRIQASSVNGLTGLNYTVSSVSGGTFRRSGVAVTTFSHADLVNGLMTVLGSPDPSGLMAYSLYATDSQGEQSNTVTGSILALIYTTFDPVVIGAAGETIVMTTAMLRCTQLGYQTDFSYQINATNRVSFTLNGSPATIFTSNDLAAGSVSLIFDGLGPPSTSFIIRRAGETVGDTVYYQIRPTITIASIETASSSGTLLSSSNLFCVDWTSSATQLTWTVITSFGCVFTRSNLEVTSFTQANVNNGLIRLKSTVVAGGSGGSGGGFAAFTLKVTDQEGLISNQVSGSAQIV